MGLLMGNREGTTFLPVFLIKLKYSFISTYRHLSKDKIPCNRGSSGRLNFRRVHSSPRMPFITRYKGLLTLEFLNLTHLFPCRCYCLLSWDIERKSIMCEIYYTFKNRCLN